MKKGWLAVFGFAILLPIGVFMLNHAHSEKQIDKKTIGPMAKQTGLQSQYSFPPIQNWVTQNGAKVYFVQSTALPMLDIQVVFDAGSARNGDKGGLSLMTSALLAEGTKSFDASEIHERFEEVGAEFETDAQRDMASLRLRSLSQTKYLDQALATLAEVVNLPTFPQEAFDRERNNALIALQNDAQNPSKIASKKFYELVFDTQPYAKWTLGTEESLKALKRDDLEAFHKQFYVAQNAVIAMVGDIPLNRAKQIAELITEKMTTGEAAPKLPNVPDLKSSHVEKVAFPSEQTHILLGAPGIKRIDEDYFPLVVGNHILGSNGTVHRIFKAVRNDKGLAYDAQSYFIPMRERGPFVLGLQTKKESATAALDILNKVVSTFVQDGPTEEELTMAKQNLLGGFALRFDSNEAICSNLATIGFYGLELDYFDKYPKLVEQVTTTEIKTAFQKRVHPDKFVTVLVGQT